MVCLRNKPRSFCHFWHFRIFKYSKYSNIHKWLSVCHFTIYFPSAGSFISLLLYCLLVFLKMHFLGQHFNSSADILAIAFKLLSSWLLQELQYASFSYHSLLQIDTDIILVIYRNSRFSLCFGLNQLVYDVSRCESYFFLFSWDFLSILGLLNVFHQIWELFSVISSNILLILFSFSLEFLVNISWYT